MRLVVIGCGYVGLVSGVCFALKCKNLQKVTFVEKDEKKLELLRSGKACIYEDGLQDVLDSVYSKLSFEGSLSVESLKADIIMVAVGTPDNKDGSVNVEMVEAVLEEISQLSCNSKAGSLSAVPSVVIKSTVPPLFFQQQVEKHGKRLNIISNPEFLREGRAIADFVNPDRVVIGATKPQEANSLLSLYLEFCNKDKIFITDCVSAQLIKYCSNAYLATRVAFVNEVATMSRQFGGNIADVVKGVGMDSRIGSEYFYPGPGFGGSCFPKDVSGIVHLANKYSTDLPLMRSILPSNSARMNYIANFIINIMQDNELSSIGILGVAFKANTDDTRYSPAVQIINIVSCAMEIKRLNIFDPKAIVSSQAFCGLECVIEKSAEDAIKNSDIVIIFTPWDEFKLINLSEDTPEVERWKRQERFLQKKNLVDLCNVIDVEYVNANSYTVYKLS